MNLDDRVNMSLGDIIKSNKKAKQVQKKDKLKKNPKSTKPGPTSDQKTAKSVGQGKAKRAAAINQKRGLSASGKPSNAQVKTAVKKQVASATSKLKKQKPAGKIAAAAPTKASGLRISFKTADLGSTTEKNMAAQIRGVLSKDPTSKRNANVKKTQQAVRQVVQNKAPPKKKIVIRRLR